MWYVVIGYLCGHTIVLSYRYAENANDVAQSLINAKVENVRIWLTE